MRIILILGDFSIIPISELIMDNKHTYIPFLDIPDVSTGSSLSTYKIKQSDGSEVTVSFGDDGKLDEISKSLLSQSDTATYDKIRRLERKVNEMNFIGIEDSDEEKSSLDDDELAPFDPSTISIEKKTISMDTIVRRLGQRTFILNPGFQRKEIWDDDRRCKLIESLLLKIPIPMFYVSADASDNWTVVDGLQRLSTIRDFVLGKYMDTHEEEDRGKGFALFGLDFCGKQLNGCTMKELPTVFYNRIMETELTFTIINPGTPEDVKRNIFKRINTGGIMLSPQEIRNALYCGSSSELLIKLAKLPIFSEATCWSVKSERMEDKELILRFISFLIRSHTAYYRTQSIDDWLCDTMLLLNNRENLNVHEIRRLVKEKRVTLATVNCMSDEDITDRFVLAMQRCKALFGPHAFRKSLPPYRRAPINKTLFETWGVILSQLTEQEFTTMMKNKVALIRDYEHHLWDDAFVRAISRDSMSRSSVSYRYSLLSQIINKYTC